VVALTGVILYGFVIGQMLGNLKVLTGNIATGEQAGEPDIDIYAALLRTVSEPLVPYSFILWSVRIVLLVALILHLYTLAHLATRNRNARQTRYAVHKQTEASTPARLMLVSGFLVDIDANSEYRTPPWLLIPVIASSASVTEFQSGKRIRKNNMGWNGYTNL
jgi:succinate dehydrogenase / fumarate reductase cytochrome b subunit